MVLKFLGLLLIFSIYGITPAYAWESPPNETVFGASCNGTRNCFDSHYAYYIGTSNATVYMLLSCPAGYDSTEQYKIPPGSDTFAEENGVSGLRDTGGFIDPDPYTNTAQSNCVYVSAQFNTSNSTWSTTGVDATVKQGPINDVFYSPIAWWCSDAANCSFSAYGIGTIALHGTVNPINLATLNIDQNTATSSASLGLAYLDFNGDTTTSSATMQCKVDILQSCTGGESAAFTTDSPVAHVQLRQQYTSTTELYGSGSTYFSGYDWGAGDSTWVADRVTVPYRAGMDCSYPSAVICTDNGEIVFQQNASENPNLEPEQPAGLMSPGYTTPETSNPLIWLWNTFRNWFIGFFTPTLTLTGAEITQLQENFSTKAPIAYFYALQGLDFTDVTASTGSPTFNLAVAAENDYGIPESISITTPQSIGDFFRAFRTGVSVMIWLVFIIYLLFLGRRLF